MRRRDCPICLDSEIAYVFENVMAAVDGMDMSYTIGRCLNCGFHFAYQLADDSVINRYYRTASKYDISGEISRLDQHRFDSVIRICEGFVPWDAMVVDIGCGYGALLDCMAHAGWTNLHGVDPAPKSAQRAKERFGLTNIHLGTIDTAHTAVPLERADMVCFLAVLEHLPNLRQDMIALLSRLRPGCQILIEVPGLDLFKAKGAEPFGEFSLEHIQFFSAESLRNLFARLGATTVKLETVEYNWLESGSVFGLFRNTGDQVPLIAIEPEEDTIFKAYVDGSRLELRAALQRIPLGPLVIYGAGSHTARLLPYLERSHARHLLAIVDSNANLIGKTMGRWIVQSPEALAEFPDAFVVVSSFRFQNEIAARLAMRFANNVVLMYDK